MNDLFSYAQDTALEDTSHSPTSKTLKPAVDTLSVTQLSNQLKLVIEGEFNKVRVEGEVSDLKKAASGHIYFSLKDDSNVIQCVMWRTIAERSAAATHVADLSEGAHVVVQGKLTTYGARSTYQITVSKVVQAGAGALMQRFETLKAQLSSEGLFDQARKHALPFLPQKIGIITSPTGAVIEDMLHRLEDRFPRHVMLYPARVQGVGAKEQITEGIAYFNGLHEEKRPDVLVVARGGGSLEDLWVFNEEIVVRALAASHIPTVSAIGHEPDTTLCDYVADVRAPTPTAAAEFIVPVREEVQARLDYVTEKLTVSVRQKIERARERVTLLQTRFPNQQGVIHSLQQRLDDQQDQLLRAIKNHLYAAKNVFDYTAKRIHPDALRVRVSHARALMIKQEKLLESYAPDGPLKRGYAYVTDDSGSLLRCQYDAVSGDTAILHFVDGTRSITFGDET